jgi:hypothetical protein
MQGRKADEAFTCADWTFLCNHLHNENGSRRYVMGFSKYRIKHYLKAKRHPVDRAISWAWSTICGRAKSKLTFVPYSSNENKQSRWGSCDFDAHDSNFERARNYAFRAFQVLLNEPDLVIILEGSGSGGWHVWAISCEFRPIRDWVKLLKTVAAKIGAPLQAGVCEIFPPDSTPSEYGKGMRAPGSWNPGTDTFSQIYWHNCDPLLTWLAEQKQKSRTYFPEKKKQKAFSTSPSQESGLYLMWSRQWSAQFAIVLESTRNDLLGRLVGTIFYQVGHEMAKKLVMAQFAEKKVQTNASQEGHLNQFEDYWRRAEANWLAQLTESERTAFDKLTTANERDAFRIIRSFQRKAFLDSQTDFAIARDNLAERLGITGKGAAWLRDKLVSNLVIKQTVPYKPNKAAARYRWLPEFRITTEAVEFRNSHRASFATPL